MYRVIISRNKQRGRGSSGPKIQRVDTTQNEAVLVRAWPRLSASLEMSRSFKLFGLCATAGCSAATLVLATDVSTNALDSVGAKTSAETPAQTWNWHVQNTDIVQYHPGFPASYSGPNSLSSADEVRETVSLDLYAGAQLWRGVEAHIDGLMWQGFGLSKTLGVEGFPNGEAFRLGTK